MHIKFFCVFLLNTLSMPINTMEILNFCIFLSEMLYCIFHLCISLSLIILFLFELIYFCEKNCESHWGRNKCFKLTGVVLEFIYCIIIS